MLHVTQDLQTARCCQIILGRWQRIGRLIEKGERERRGRLRYRDRNRDRDRKGEKERERENGVYRGEREGGRIGGERWRERGV